MEPDKFASQTNSSVAQRAATGYRYNRNRAITDDMPYLLGGVASEDEPTRRMTWVFLVSLVALLAVGIYSFHYFTVVRVQRARQLSNPDAQLEEFFKKQKREALSAQPVMVNLGTFILEMKKVPNSKRAPGVVNMGEVEIVVECKNIDTRDFLTDHYVQVKSQLTNIFTPLDREELLSREGKKSLKRDIVRKLNSWLPEGMAINEVFFERLILN